MIGTITKGSNFKGLLKYLLSKEKAQLLDSNMLGGDYHELSAEFNLSVSLRPTVARPVYHVSLSLDPGEKLSEIQWSELARKYLDQMGFGDSQFVAVKHSDRHHKHLHIVTSKIDLDGQVVNTQYDYFRSQTIIRNLEVEYQLKQLQSSWVVNRRQQPRREIELLNKTWDKSVRRHLQTTIDSVVKHNSSLTVPQLLQKLDERQINHQVHYADNATVRGLSYSYNGINYSGTSLGRAYTFPGLQKHRGIQCNNHIEREIYQTCSMSPQTSIATQQLLQALARQQQKQDEIISSQKRKQQSRQLEEQLAPVEQEDLSKKAEGKPTALGTRIGAREGNKDLRPPLHSLSSKAEEGNKQSSRKVKVNNKPDQSTPLPSALCPLPPGRAGVGLPSSTTMEHNQSPQNNDPQKNGQEVFEWGRFAKAIGQSDAYLNRVVEIISDHKQGQSLDERAVAAFNKDYDQYCSTQSQLRQWYEAAQKRKASLKYLNRITEVTFAFNAPVPTPLSEKVIAAMNKDLALTSARRRRALGDQLPVTSEQQEETKNLSETTVEVSREQIPETNTQISHNQEETKVLSNTEQLPEAAKDLSVSNGHLSDSQQQSTDEQKSDQEKPSVDKNLLGASKEMLNAHWSLLTEKIEELAKDTAKAQAQIVAESVEYTFRNLLEHHTSVEMKQTAEILHQQLLKLSERSVNQFATHAAQKALDLENELKASESLGQLFSDYINDRKQIFDVEELLGKYIQIRGGDISVNQLLTELSEHRDILESTQTVLDEYAQKQQHKETVEALLEEYINARDTANAIEQVLYQHGERQNGALELHTQQWQMQILDGELTVTTFDDNREILKVNGTQVLKFSEDPNEQKQLTKFAAWTRTELAQAQASQSQQLNNNRSRGRGR